MNSVFSEQILADKLSKLNNSQQCIETLSHWCIFHQKKADLVVATWDKQFHSAEDSQKVPFLYLANDILQNSKRKGNEFVSEFWKVLPAAIKYVNEKCEDHGKSVVSRLVNIWEERKVFGRARGLKDLMLGNEPLPPLELGRKRSRSVRIMKRDSRSIRTKVSHRSDLENQKLAIGGSAEKIVSAFNSVLSERSNEDSEMSKCKTAVKLMRKMEKDVDTACSRARNDPRRTSLASEVEEEENLLKQCIEKLKPFEETRAALVSQLREALHEQESELENVRTQLQVAQAQVEESINMRKRLKGENVGGAPKKSAAAIAAEVADKLAASSSSQSIMSSVLSTFAAEAAKNAGLTTSSTPSNSFSLAPVASSTDTRLKFENSMPVANSNAYVAAPSQQLSSTYSLQLGSTYQTALVHQPLVQAQASSAQTQYHVIPNPPSQHYVQPSGGVTSGLPYGYGSLPPLPAGPPPPPPLTRLATPLLAQQIQVSQTPQQPMPLIQQPTVQQPMSLIQQTPVQQQMPLSQQPLVPPSFRPLQPPGMMYYTHHQQPPQ